MKYAKRVARKDHTSSCGAEIKKGDIYYIRSFVGEDLFGEPFFWKAKFTEEEYRMDVKSDYKKEQHERRFKRFIERLESEYIFKWDAFKHDSPTFKVNKQGVFIDTHEPDMVTDDPFPMYQYLTITHKLVERA